MNYNFVTFLAKFVDVFANILVWSIIARIVVSWMSMSGKPPHGKIFVILRDVTDPVINFFRFLPHKYGMIDFAPLIAMLVLDFGSQLFVRFLSLI